MTDPIFQLVPWVVFIPVIGLLVNILIGSRIGEKAVGAIASLAAAGSFAVAVALAFGLGAMAQPEAVIVPFLEWIKIGTFSVNWAFRVDTLSVTMMLVSMLIFV